MNYSHEIKNAVTMREVCNAYGLDINSGGFARCPFHQGDNSPSMKIYPGNRGFHCFACGAGSSVIDFVMKYFNLSFIDAERKLNDDFGLALPIDGELSDRKKKQAERTAKNRADRQKSVKEQHRRLKATYEKALDDYTRTEKTKREAAPSGPDDEISDEYIKACQRLPKVAYDLGEAESRLREFELRMKS